MRSRAAAIALLLASGLGAGTARAEGDVRGYLLSRFQLFPAARRAVLYPMLEVEKFQGFLEGNVDFTLKGDGLTLRSDTSALYRVSPSGCREGSDAPGCLVINELYLTIDVVPDHLILLVGRHRPSWGSALSYHPVEAMNPQPDPTDPGFQRLGAWTAMTELSGEHYVATAAWFPKVSHSAIGTPDSLSGGLAGGRIAWRPSGFDVSGIFFYDLENRLPEGGLSASAVLGSSPFEVHGEALVHQRREIDTGNLKQGTCPIRSLGIPHREEWDYTALGGARWDQGDGTLVNLEYLHNGDGMVANDFNAVLNTADLLNEMCPEARLETPDSSEDGRPQQLSSTLLRRNYVILSGVKPNFGDDGWRSNLGAVATVFAGLDDRSGVVTARAIYTLQQSTIVRVGGLYRFGGDRTQYGILPFHGEVLIDVQSLF